MSELKFTGEELIGLARDDAVHGVVAAAALDDDHPLQQLLREHFSAIIKAIDAHTSSCQPVGPWVKTNPGETVRLCDMEE